MAEVLSNLMIVAVMMIAMVKATVQWISRKEEGRSYKTVLLPVMVITHFNFPHQTHIRVLFQNDQDLFNIVVPS